MPSVVELRVAGEPMHVFADRALYWPARERLLIADLHLGKGNIFRRAGISVPSGGTRHDLARLDVLMRRTGARELWILGDFLHGARHPDVEQAWIAFLAAHAGIKVCVVAGNHDRAVIAAAFEVQLLPEDICEGPFRFRHHPMQGSDAMGGHVLCGHLHPVVRLPELPGRYPAFKMDGAQTVLPAFSAFTGGFRIDDRASQWIACPNGELIANLR